MALTIYPDENYNSYVSVADALVIASDFITDSFTALTTTMQEKYLKQSTLLIKLKIDESLISDVINLQLATVHLANYSIGKDMLTSDGGDNVQRLKIEGAIEKEYFSRGRKSNSFPDMVNSLLSEYGLKSSSTITIERV